MFVKQEVIDNAATRGTEEETEGFTRSRGERGEKDKEKAATEARVRLMEFVIPAQAGIHVCQTGSI
jgi:hypothetical protein